MSDAEHTSPESMGATGLRPSRTPWRRRIAAAAVVAVAALALPSAAAQKGAVGDSCKVDADCASALCGLWSGGGKRCYPRERQPADAPCVSNDHCLADLYCSSEQKCTRWLELGALCWPGERSGCRSGFCERGHVYADGDELPGRCVPPARTGKANHYCTKHEQCEAAYCTPTNVCGAAAGLGEPCPGGNQQCLTRSCDAGPGSGGSQKCVPDAGKGKPGDYCTLNAHCQYKVCTTTVAKCAPAAELGQSCPFGNLQCKSGFCDAGPGSGGTNKCVPAASTGRADDYCSQNAHCALRMCVQRKCLAQAELGQPCPLGNLQCKSGFCDVGGGSGGTQKCVPPAGTGTTNDYCSQNGHCKPGRKCTANRCR